MIDISKQIEIYCRDRITNKGELIGTTDTREDINMIISDYIGSIGLDTDTIETTAGHGNCCVHRMENVIHLVFISREEDSKYDFY